MQVLNHGDYSKNSSSLDLGNTILGKKKTPFNLLKAVVVT